MLWLVEYRTDENGKFLPLKAEDGSKAAIEADSEQEAASVASTLITETFCDIRVIPIPEDAVKRLSDSETE